MRQSISKMKNVIFLLFAAYFFIYQNGTSPDEALGQEYTVVSSPLAFNAGADTVMTEKEYYSRLQAADEVTFKQDFENYFLFLLNAEQKKAYKGLQSLGDKKAVIQYYWKASNPNPLFPENDWLLEFNRRVQYAKKHFRHTSPPYVDDRGRYYIKYGEPRRRFVDTGGLVSLVSYDDDFRIRSRYVSSPDVSSDEDDPAKKYGGINRKKPKPSGEKDDTFYIPYWTLPNETWSYENIEPNFVVYFVRDGASYRQVRSIYDAVTDRHAVRNAIGAADPNLEYFIWRDMIDKRQHISAALARAVLPMRIYETGPPQNTLKHRAGELTFHIEAARYKAPSAFRYAIQAENKLKFFDRVTQFRGPAGKTRIDVALLAPLKKNLIKKVTKSLKDTLNLEFSGMLRDINFEPVTKNQSSSPLAVALAVREKLPNAVGNVSLLATPQEAELTLQVVEKQGNKTGYQRQPFHIRDFSTRTELLLSDIQLCYQAKNGVQKKILPTLPTVQHPDFLVSPYPFHEIRKKKPVLVYFEIYNIQSAGMDESMKISYTISSIKGSRASVDVSFTRPVHSENMHEIVEIDLKNVKKGWNLLKVSVSSLQDSTIQAVAQKKLSVKE